MTVKKMLLDGLILLLILPSFVVSATAKLLPKGAPVDRPSSAPEADEHRRLKNVDARRDPGALVLNGATALAAKRAPVDRTAAIDALIAQAPLGDPNSLVVDLHASGVPKTVVNFDGVLTSARSGSPDTIARDFLAEHSALFGLSPDEVQNLRITMDNLDEESGVTYLKYEQMVGSLPVFDSEIGVTISAHGEVVIVNQGQTLPGAVVSTDAIAPEQAITKAFEHCGVEVSADALRPSASERDQASELIAYENPLGQGRPDVLSQKTVVNVNGEAVLAYRTIVPKQGGEVYDTLVDANSGELLVRSSLVHDVQGQVFKRDPTKGRTLEQFTPLFGVADPWPGASTLTSGNNVGALSDRDGGDGWEPVTTGATGPNAGLSYGFADSAKGTPAGQFSFAWSVAADPTTQQAASVTNLFYLCNYMHDWMYSLGFTESARNFQDNNYGRGGVGSDYVIAEAQDALFPNNSSFTALPDGYAGILEVGIYTTVVGPKDASLDGDVVLHEYGHGVSSRLIGNGSGLSGTQSAALGEGWSDYWAISNYNDGVIGEYSTYNNVRGLRRAAYTVPANWIHDSYADLGAYGFQAHNDGEIWAATLWDLNQTLGKTKADRIILAGMKNTPTSPSFVSARTGIITACQTLYPADVRRAWEVFARHGLGYSASGNDGTTHNAATNLPPGYGGSSTCTPTPMSAAIMSPQTLTGTLAPTDCLTPAGNLANSAFFDRFTFSAPGDQVVTISMNATAFDTYLRLKDGNGAVVASNNNYNGNVNAKIIYTVAPGQTYTIEALSWSQFVTGAYTVTLAISNVPGGRCESGHGLIHSETYVVERSGEHIIRTHYTGFFSLQKWDGADWQQVYAESYNINNANGWSSYLRQVGVYNGGPGAYRWVVSNGSKASDFCYDWP
jgi:Zn-dependent metalloprotease